MRLLPEPHSSTELSALLEAKGARRRPAPRRPRRPRATAGLQLQIPESLGGFWTGRWSPEVFSAALNLMCCEVEFPESAVRHWLYRHFAVAGRCGVIPMRAKYCAGFV